MKLPHYERCEVPEAKITRYLLDLTSEAGQTKARYFLAFGFTIEKWGIMAAALKQHAADHELASVRPMPHGTHYLVEGELRTPDGRNPLVRSVWKIDENREVPVLVTAYPL